MNPKSMCSCWWQWNNVKPGIVGGEIAEIGSAVPSPYTGQVLRQTGVTISCPRIVWFS